MAKPVTSESLWMPASSPRFTGLFLLVNERQDLVHVRLDFLVRPDVQHRRNPADYRLHHRRRIPACRVEAERLRNLLWLVEHDDHYIARLFHREHRRERRDVDGLAI